MFSRTHIQSAVTIDEVVVSRRDLSVLNISLLVIGLLIVLGKGLRGGIG